MKMGEKVVWLFILCFLLVAEVQSILRDHKESIEASQQARKQQDDNFQKVLEDQQEKFDKTLSQLKSQSQISQEHYQQTIKGLHAQLRAINQTIDQTRSKAVVVFKAVSYKNSRNSGLPLEVTYTYENQGNDTARTIWVFAKVYLASRQKDVAEREIRQNFEESSAEYKQVTTPGQVIAQGDAKFMTDTGTTDSLDNLNKLRSGSVTVYTVFRVQFSDSTGTWQTDNCDRRLENSMNVTGCGFYGETRYPVPN